MKQKIAGEEEQFGGVNSGVNLGVNSGNQLELAICNLIW